MDEAGGALAFAAAASLLPKILDIIEPNMDIDRLGSPTLTRFPGRSENFASNSNVVATKFDARPTRCRSISRMRRSRAHSLRGGAPGPRPRRPAAYSTCARMSRRCGLGQGCTGRRDGQAALWAGE